MQCFKNGKSVIPEGHEIYFVACDQYLKQIE